MSTQEDNASVGSGMVVGLLTFKSIDRIRGMHTLPEQLVYTNTNPKIRYKIFYYEDIKPIHKSLGELRKKYNLIGFLSFPRNTEKIFDQRNDYVNSVDILKNNVMFWSSEYSPLELKNKYSNGYFYGRSKGMRWWWSFLGEKDPDPHPNSNPQRCMTGTFGFYTRSEHYNHEYYPYITKYLESSINVFGRIEVITTGEKKESLVFIDHLKQFKDDIDFIHTESKDDFINHLKTNGTYLATKLINDSIPNLLHEIKQNNINCKIFDRPQPRQTLVGLDEVILFTARKTYIGDHKILRDNISLILDPAFRKKYRMFQDKHVLKYPEPSEISFNSAVDSTIELILSTEIL